MTDTGDWTTAAWVHETVIVAGNTVFGHTGTSDIGIRGSLNVDIRLNVVHSNYDGISLLSSALAEENRVYNNSNRGILASGSGLVSRNVIYSNTTGIEAATNASGPITNNLVYDHTTDGMLIRASAIATLEIVNNTVFEQAADAVRIEGGSRNVDLRNNVLWVQAGSALNVAGDSQLGFTSDHNLLYATGSGQVGTWQAGTRPTLTSWQNAAFTDQNSISQNPLFVDPAGHV